MGKSKLGKKTIAEVHDAILKSGSLDDAAYILGAKGQTLGSHLGKFSYNDKPLTFDVMKGLTVDDAKAVWKGAYDQPMTPRNLQQMTVAEIHAVILGNDYLNNAAKKLGVGSTTLSRHLGKFRYNDEPLTFDVMKGFTVDDAKGIWGEAYDQPMKAPQINLQHITVAAIHKVILASKSLDIAAQKLGVGDYTLGIHLGRLLWDGEPLTFKVMKGLTVEQAKEIWGELYGQPIAAIKSNLEQMTVARIHWIILESDSLAGAAHKLGVERQTLGRHLGKFRYNDDPLTFDVMKGLTVDDAKRIWGEAYDQPMKAPQVNLQQKTVAEIHRLILESDSLAEAAQKLGVTGVTLRCHLGKLDCNDEPLTFNVMKGLTVDDAKAAWAEAYEQQPMVAQKVNLKNITVAEIHQVILSSDYLDDAAVNLGVSVRTLTNYLKKLRYNDEPLSFKKMKKLSGEEAQTILEFQDAVPIDTISSPAEEQNIIDLDLSIIDTPEAAGAADAAEETINTELVEPVSESRDHYFSENASLHTLFAGSAKRAKSSGAEIATLLDELIIISCMEKSSDSKRWIEDLAKKMNTVLEFSLDLAKGEPSFKEINKEQFTNSMDKFLTVLPIRDDYDLILKRLESFSQQFDNCWLDLLINLIKVKENTVNYTHNNPQL